MFNWFSIEIVLETLENCLFCGIVADEIFLSFELGHQFLFLSVKCFGNVNADVDDEVSVASSVALHFGQPFSSEP